MRHSGHRSITSHVFSMAKWLRRPTVNRKIPSSTLGGEVFLFSFFLFASFIFYFFLKTFFFFGPLWSSRWGVFALDMHDGMLWVRWWDRTYSPSLAQIALPAFEDGFQC